MISPASEHLESHKFFTLLVQVKDEEVHIEMKLSTDILNTCLLPQTLQTLRTNFPSVLKTECFNEENLSFQEEVQRTEIGHLFEHILLESLCLEEMAEGKHESTFSGRTDWNWEKEHLGVFHIFVNSGKAIAHLLPNAMKTAVHQTELVLETGKAN
jgi:hypothetical protein